MRPMPRRLVAAIAAAFGCVSASAATITVTTGGDAGDTTTCTLRQALDSANADAANGSSTCADGSGADTIVFDPSLAGATITLGGSQLLIDSDLTLQGSGQVVDANQASRAINLYGSCHVTLSNLTVQNGDAGSYRGGGLYIDSCTAALQNLTISGNTASTGGGIFVEHTAFTLTDSVVKNNTATGAGGPGEVAGGILSLSNSVLTLDHVVLDGNTANYNHTGTAAVGGLYDFDSSVSISDSTISGNSASAQLPLTSSSVSGGVYANRSLSFSMLRSTVAGNSAVGTGVPGQIAGGMTLYRPGQPSLRNVTFAQNSASSAQNPSYYTVGGLIVQYPSTSASLSNLTISGNSATTPDLGSSAFGGAALLGTVDLFNSIASGNSGASAADLALSSDAQLHSDLLGFALQSKRQGNGNRFADDPRLAPLANNGGPTPTQAPLPDSPAINAGDNALVPVGDTTDQRGAGFPRIVGSAVDMGAFEFAGSEREALIGLYLATNGGGWTHNTNWCNGACPASGVPDFNAPGTECSWYGVVCDGAHTHVLRLELATNNLSGGPLPDLTWLTQLTTLNLYSNAISGPLPDLHSLTQLVTYALFDNRFTGSIPANVASWPALVTFQVSDNPLSGVLPSLTGASQLQDFEAARAGLAGPLPSLSGLTQLSYFDVQSNRLSGALPSLVDLAPLFVFTVNDNALSGPLPALGAFAQLNVFDVDTNQFSGSVPSLAGLNQLRYASFANNQLSGAFPALSGATSLGFLDVSSNQLSGSLPADLSGFTNLRALYVQSNRFSGALPLAPPALAPNFSSFCPNALTLAAGPSDSAWNAATGQTPWWGPSGGGCDGVSAGGFELLGNGSFEHGIANWHIAGGTCLWQTAKAGTVSAGYGRWRAPAPIDGSVVLISDNQNGGDCNLYQDVTVPPGVASASFSAAVGYNVRTPWDERCHVDLSVTTPAGAEIAPYVTLQGPNSLPLTQYTPVTFAVQPGDVLRIAVHTTDRCGNFATGIVLDNVDLSLH